MKSPAQQMAESQRRKEADVAMRKVALLRRAGILEEYIELEIGGRS